MSGTRDSILKLAASKSPVIAISGKQFSGKDTVAHLLLEALPGFQQIPIARAIKQAYAAQHNLTLEAIETDKATHRPGLIALGNWGRAQDADYWLKHLLEIPGAKIISDLRLRHEYDLLKANGAFLIRVNAERAVRAQRGTLVSETDPTECDLDDIPPEGWDIVIENNGSLEMLYAALQDETLLS